MKLNRDFKTERSKRINIDYAEEAKDFLWRYTIQYK
jgi:DNA-3-methyladenine glycosylase